MSKGFNRQTDPKLVREDFLHLLLWVGFAVFAVSAILLAGYWGSH